MSTQATKERVGPFLLIGSLFAVPIGLAFFYEGFKIQGDTLLSPSKLTCFVAGGLMALFGIIFCWRHNNDGRLDNERWR